MRQDGTPPHCVLICSKWMRWTQGWNKATNIAGSNIYVQDASAGEDATGGGAGRGNVVDAHLRALQRKHQYQPGKLSVVLLPLLRANGYASGPLHGKERFLGGHCQPCWKPLFA